MDHTDNVPTISFLFVDQVGSTAQLQTLGDEKAAPVRRSLFDILQSALTAHGGTQVDNTGDGIMATFTSAVDSVECAAAIQRAVRRHKPESPTRRVDRGASRCAVTGCVSTASGPLFSNSGMSSSARSYS